MTVRLESTIKRFTGLSTDKRPEPRTLGGRMNEGEPLPPGSVFYELDTGKEYRWDGGLWFPMPDVANLLLDQRPLLEDIVNVLKEVRDLLKK